MSFLSPIFLAGTAAIVIPILLHLLRRDVAPEVPFSAVRLLRRTPLERTRRHRIRDLLLLAARVTALVLLAGAFARPYFAGGTDGSSLRIVAVDRSYSMGAPGRFERAIALAREAIDAAGSGEEVAVFAFDDRVEVLAGPGPSAAARSALDALRPGFGGTRFSPLLTRAAELSQGSDARLIVVTDMQRAGWEDGEPVLVPARLLVETRDAGASGVNAAVVFVGRAEDGLIATVRNTGDGPLQGNLRARAGGRAVASAPFAIASGATADVRLPYEVPDRGAVSVEIDDPAGYVADNTRHLILDPPDRTRVLVIGEGAQPGFYVTRALEAANPVAAYDVTARAARSVGSLTPEDFAANRVVLLLSTRHLDRRAREVLPEYVRGGGGLLIAAGSDVEPAVLRSMMRWPGFSAVEQRAGGAVLAATDLRHPIFLPFGTLAANLGQVRFTRAWLVGGEGWEVAARFTDGSPAVLERREGQGRVLVFASDLERRWNDFPLHPSFVPFTIEVVRHLAPAGDRRRDYDVADVPPGVPAVPGVQTPPDGRPVSVNVDVRESATARMGPDEFATLVERVGDRSAAIVERRAQAAEARQSLWRYGLLLMLTALVAESMVGRIR